MHRGFAVELRGKRFLGHIFSSNDLGQSRFDGLIGALARLDIAESKLVVEFLLCYVDRCGMSDDLSTGGLC
jgi:hypothetical protein